MTPVMHFSYKSAYDYNVQCYAPPNKDSIIAEIFDVFVISINGDNINNEDWFV